tara:strand:- start:139 stop:336 length:198 start_codon:yes stop_codon:yes gene_type:complete
VARSLRRLGARSSCCKVGDRLICLRSVTGFNDQVVGKQALVAGRDDIAAGITNYAGDKCQNPRVS